MVGRFAGWIGEGLLAGAGTAALRGAGGGAAIGAATGGAGSLLNPDQSFIGGVGKGALMGGAVGGIGGGIAGRRLEWSSAADARRYNNINKRGLGGAGDANIQRKVNERTATLGKERKWARTEVGNTGIGRGAMAFAGATAVAGGGVGLFGSSNKRHTRVRSNSIPAGF